MNILDGASGQETQIIIERCFFHDNPYSNLYLGHNRRANKVMSSTFNYSGTGDGILFLREVCVGSECSGIDAESDDR